MKDFEYFKINEYENYVLLTSNKDVYFLYDEIEKILDKNEKIILIDMFYRNGFSFNRFAEVVFRKDEKPFSRIVNMRSVSEDVKNNTKQFFMNHQNLLDISLLSKSIKNFVLSD